MNKHNLILVADDDDNDLRMTLEALAPRGADLEVRTVRDGAEALDYLYSREAFKDRPAGNPGMVLLDLNMPRIDGWEVLRRIKSDAALHTIPVVVFTSSSREHDVDQCYALGANAYVVKPIDYHEFTEVVRAIRHFWTEHNLPPAAGRAVEAVLAPAGARAGSPP